ncbi:papain-like cysteine protease family protein [Taibaiella koreensis]|uniref:papain-like cysteine protease family protein n=1 Tax=Taibaiella koreensis TaxID=1268548 RepID=UPI0013C30E32|nr:papain-like cysteine protease family protein [Taibaiella koreensis]
MASLHQTLHYEGSNLSQILSDFPSFKQVQASFQVPAYDYIPLGDGFAANRNFLRTEALSKALQLDSTRYQLDLPLSLLAGSNMVGFLYYWGTQVNMNGQTPPDLQRLTDELSLGIDVKINNALTQQFTALPFLLLSDYLASRSSNTLMSHRENLAAMTVNRDTDAATDKTLEEYLNDTLVLLNMEALRKLAGTLPNVSFASLFVFVALSFKKDGENLPVMKVPTFQVLAAQAKQQFNVGFSDSDYNQLKKIPAAQYEALWDFPVAIPEVKPAVVKGEVVFTGTEPVQYSNFSSYDLVLDYAGQSVKYAWNNYSTADIPDRKTDFDFYATQDVVIDTGSADPVTVSVKLYDGNVLWRHTYAADDTKLQKLHIELPLVKVPVLGDDPSDPGASNKPLRGQVVELSGKCSLKDLTVILQAKALTVDPVWKVIGVATTDITGSFTMPYPLGSYEAAQAFVSLSPDETVPVRIIPVEEQHSAQQTIANDFIYLLVESADCGDDEDADDDCECHSSDSKTPRLPEQSDLIGSDKYSQDLGGGTCMNLTTPNRTLSEHTYFAIVRTSDPDVANYVLEKNTIQQADGFKKVTFTLGEGKKVERKEVTYENPIRWQDAPDTTDKDNHLSLYQAVNVAHGHLLTYKSVLKADGYSLGDLLYSLPLAPGQKKQIAVFDYKRTLQGSESQQLTQREGLNAALVNDRSIIDDLSGSISEYLQGQSTANTGGVSAGLGVGAILGPVGAVLGVSGGYSSASSSASQQSSRNTSQAFGETLRNAIMQSSSAYRSLNGTLIDTISEGQQYAATTEVVANHNHCHSLTMLYFEVLRHYAVFQELVGVEECLFVPLIMTNFSMENIHKWRDVLAASLMYRPSNTYLPLFRNRNPLLKGFDANDRVLTNWTNVDFPANRYCDDTIIEVTGQINFRVSIPRPKTRFDRILSLPIIKKTITTQGGVDVVGTVEENIKNAVIGAIVPCAAGGPTIKRQTNTSEVITRGQIFDMFMTLDANYETVPPARCIRVNFDSVDSPSIPFLFFNDAYTPLDFFAGMDKEKKIWDGYASLLGMSTNELLRYFNNNVIADWDQIFNDHIAPMIIAKLIDQTKITIQPLNGLDLTALDKYNGGNRLLRYNFRASTAKTRAEIDKLNILYNIAFSNKMEFFNFIDAFRVESLRVNYATPHYTGTIANETLNDDLVDGISNILTPLNYDEKRNPRLEDKFIVNELITHLNSNLEYYNKVLWRNLDPDRRYLLLDGFHIQVYNDLNQPGPMKSLASIVKNQLIGIAGNSLIFPVAAGVKVDRSYIILTPNDEDQDKEVKLSLFDHYRPLTPPDPFRISVPTRGIFAEAVMGACDACEKVKDNSSQDWDRFRTDEPTTFAPVTVPTPEPTDWKAAFKDFATPIVNIQNAPALPAPGAGLQGLSELLGKNDIFKDITGLDANQKNAIATYLSNQENAKAFAQMAKDMAIQAHNTQNDDKIKSAIKDAQTNGNISKEDAGKLTKDHIQQMIDGGEAKRTDAANAGNNKPSLTDAAVKAADQGKAVKAEHTDAVTGKTEKVDIEGTSAENVLATAGAAVPQLKQENSMACWATAATMMVSWKKGLSMTVPDVLAIAGQQYVDKFNAGQGLQSAEKEAFITALGMVGEPPASYTLQTYINWLKTYGPLWITTDSSTATGPFSPHARILTKITGTGTPDGQGTYFTFNDPATGTEVKESFTDFLNAYEQMVTDNPGALFIQIVHFSDPVTPAGEGGPAADPTVQDLNTNKPSAPDTVVINKSEFKAVTGLSNWKPAGALHNTNLFSKRTSNQVIHLVLHETAADTGDGFSSPNTAHMAVRADATITQFNDLLENEQHANNFNTTSVGVEFVNRGWLASPKDDDSAHPPYSYEHEAIPSKQSQLSAAQKDKFKEANGYLWCFWGFGFGVYRLPQNMAQLEKEVELVKWLTVDLPPVVKAWKDGGGWLSGKPELTTLAGWLSLPGVPAENKPLLDLPTISNTWLQLVSYNEVKSLWTFKAADIPADADKDKLQYFIFTTGHDYITPTNFASRSGILSHNSLYAGHSDGSFQTLYTWLRLEKGKTDTKAFDLCKSLMKDHFIIASLKTNPYDKKIVLLNVSDANLV